jgi:hypothetical protein
MNDDFDDYIGKLMAGLLASLPGEKLAAVTEAIERQHPELEGLSLIPEEEIRARLSENALVRQ